MCVSQFRDYCKASKFKYSDRINDLKDKDLEVKKGTYHYHGNNYYYVTDKKELRRLAENGNEYAKKQIN